MPRTPSETEGAPPSGQMNRPYDPEERARMDREGPRLAMHSDHHARAGSAAGVGSVAYDDPGAYDVGTGDRPQVIAGEPRAFGESSFDPGDSAEADRIRAGGLGPGGADERRRMETDSENRTLDGRDADETGPIEPLARPAPPD